MSISKAARHIKATLQRIQPDLTLSPDIVTDLSSILEELAVTTYSEGYRDAVMVEGREGVGA